MPAYPAYNAHGDFERIYGSAQADRITGNDETDYIYGGDGGDSLFGKGDGDVLDAEGGARQSTNGGSGNNDICLGAGTLTRTNCEVM